MCVGPRGDLVWLLSPEPMENGLEAAAIRFGYGQEFEAETATAFHVANNRVGLDAAFLHEKIKLSGRAFLHGHVRGLDKQAVHA